MFTQQVCAEQLISQLRVLPAAGKAQHPEPTCLEPAQHTMEELQLMVQPLKATLAVLTQHDSGCFEGAAPATPMLLCHLRHLERCHPRLWIKQQQLLPDLWCGSVPGTAMPDNVTGSCSPASSSSSVCWQWLSKCSEVQEFLTGLAVLRSDLTNSSSSSADTSSTTAEASSTLIVNARLAAYESALALLSVQLASLVSGASAVKTALHSAGLLPADGGSIRAALQEATAAGKLAEWARQGLHQAQVVEGAQGGDTAWMTAVDDGQQKSELGACGLAGFSALAV
ncbi:hypothetical protein COO60DRAFT_1701128 [Scenedesmus sp. NREL 46B-D3]|nr:hypothetical protein COO60DRAFT_1701128 [Scenedesmus sp. NREL 46B-D3]